MARSPIEPTSSSRHDVTAWIAGQTRLTHEEASVVRTVVDREYIACGGAREPDQRKLHKEARCKLLPVIGFWAWLQIAGYVWNGIKLLCWLYRSDANRPEGASGGCGVSRSGGSGQDDIGEDDAIADGFLR